VAVDGGVGYTYLNPATGHEFSVIGGLTYNFMNHDLQYQNGIDFQVDWGASKFVSKNVQIGLAGYFFQQLTGDSGPGAKLGDFKGRVAGIGPQIPDEEERILPRAIVNVHPSRNGVLLCDFLPLIIAG
jgi:hypothetical protein